MHRIPPEMLRRLGLPLLLATAACGAGADPAADVQVDESLAPRIVNGTPSTSATNSVVMLAIGQDGTCTGTLIAPNLVITARHCLANIDESTQCGTFGATYASNTIAVYTGVGGNTPAALGKQTFVESSTSGCGYDMGLLVLDRDVAGAMVSPVRFTKLAKGEAVWTSGFGENGYGQLTSGRYDKRSLVVDAVGPASYTYTTKQGQSLPVTVPAGEIVTGESTCFGDSGGPLFDAKGNVVGMTSRGIDDSCIDRPSIYSDTASHVAIIQAAAKAAGHPIADAPSSSTPPSESGTSSPASDSTSGDGNDPTSAPDTTGDSGDEGTATTTTSKKRAAPVASSGCSAAPGSGRGPAGELGVGLALGLVLARRARRARPR